MIFMKPDSEFRAGTSILQFIKELEINTSDYPLEQVTLDLSDVIFMDSFSFRVVFDYLPKLNKVIPPQNQHIIDMYNLWLDSKKNLSKGN